MPCEVVRTALSDFDRCEETLDGARVATHCLYPSFESVFVYIAKVGDSYVVHDGGGAYRTAWTHGRDSALIRRALSAEADKFRLNCFGDSIISPDVSSEWLQSAILSVANASAGAANRAVSRMVQSSEAALIENIDVALAKTIGRAHIAREFVLRGKSGGERRFDFAIRTGGDEYNFLINGVFPHHASVSAKYVAFADADLGRERKLAVFDHELETDDTALLQQVASIVSLPSLPAGARRMISHV
jgi:hypothetical protein